MYLQTYDNVVFEDLYSDKQLKTGAITRKTMDQTAMLNRGIEFKIDDRYYHKSGSGFKVKKNAFRITRD